MCACVGKKREWPGKRRTQEDPETPPRNHEPPTVSNPKVKRVKVMGKGKGRKRGPGLKEKKATSQKVSPKKEKYKETKKSISKKEALKATKELKEKIEAKISIFAGRARCIHGARIAERRRRSRGRSLIPIKEEGVTQWARSTADMRAMACRLISVVVCLLVTCIQSRRGPQPHSCARGVLDSPAYGGQHKWTDRDNTKKDGKKDRKKREKKREKKEKI